MNMLNLLETIEIEIRHLEAAKKEFIAKIEKDWGYTMSWSGGAFQEAAKHAVLIKVRDALRAERITMEQLKDHARDQAMRYARFNSFSTSPTSNFYEAQTAMAWAELLERLDRS